MDANKFDMGYLEKMFHEYFKKEYPYIILYKLNVGYDKVYEAVKEAWYAGYERGNDDAWDEVQYGKKSSLNAEE